jgi:hypothetical protein
MAGYSGTPLITKLGFKPPLRVLTINAPKDYRTWLGDLPDGVTLAARTTKPLQAAHVFATDQALLHKQLATLREQLAPTGFVWVSWPKRAAKVVTDITEDRIRALALPLGLVDVKVCAVSEVWSGLKLVIRKSQRPPAR